MADLDKILAELDYVETIEHTIEEIGLTVTIAEASVVRNRPFARKLAEVMKREDTDDPTELPPEAHIEIICETLLKGWNAKRGDVDVPVSEAREIMTANPGKWHQVSIHIELAASNPARFKAERPSKKKPSSSTTPTTSGSATKPKSSKTRRKPAASRSPRGSKAS